MKIWSPLKSDKGFTLMELMIAASVVSLLAMGVAAGLSAALKAWESGERNLEMFQTKRIVCDRLISEIGNAVNLRGQKEDQEKAQMIFNGEADSLSFITTAHALMSPGLPMALKETHIGVEPGVGLVIRESMFSSTEYFDTGRGVQYVIDPSITDLTFAYYYVPRPSGGSSEDLDKEDLTGEWLSSWGPEQLEITEVITEPEDGGGDQSQQMKEKEIKMRLPLAVELLITSENEKTGEQVSWQPLIIPLKESRVLGVSIKRRARS